MKTLWILSDGLPGHLSQSLGLARVAESCFGARSITVELALKSKLLRSPMRLIANHCPSLLGRRSFSLFYHHQPLPPQQPRLIISAGGNTLFANISLARAYRVNNLFSGTLKGYQGTLPSRVFTVVPLPGVAGNVVLDLPPADSEPPAATPDLPCYSLLIGGDGAGYRYGADQWRLLAEALSEIARRDGITWKITTSRRTGKEAEGLLRSCLDTAVVSEAVWFSSNPQKVVKRFLAEGRVIFCTEDSLTMVSEAIYARKPVVTLQPEIMEPVENDRLALEKYQRLGFILRSPVSSLVGQSLEQDQFCSRYPDIHARIAEAIEPL